MINNPKKQIVVSCDFETNTALVRIYKFRNYTWSGGRVYELARDCYALKQLATIIQKYKSPTDAKINATIVWEKGCERGIAYDIDMSKVREDFKENV